jgi:hypothetical protein
VRSNQLSYAPSTNWKPNWISCYDQDSNIQINGHQGCNFQLVRFRDRGYNSNVKFNKYQQCIPATFRGNVGAGITI